MKTWWIVVRHATKEQLENATRELEPKGLEAIYPPEGFAISAFDDRERAEMYAKNSTNGQHRYEAIEVCKCQ